MLFATAQLFWPLPLIPDTENKSCTESLLQNLQQLGFLKNKKKNSTLYNLAIPFEDS